MNLIGKPKLLEKATARLNAHRVMAKKKREGVDKQKKGSANRKCPSASPHRPHAAARKPHSQQPQSQGPGLPRQPSAASAPRLSPPSPLRAKGKGQGKAAKDKPALQPGRWLDRDCNAALNMQRIGESRWRPLELCWWPEQGPLPAKGKEFPDLGYKRLRDKPPKAQQQQPAEAQ
ncbi:hypothetical protein QJQ45_006316 [Haematococcus lacustris]|nr:hypothetical protein QJQ45_006316 [Haematococcus lacustris]